MYKSPSDWPSVRWRSIFVVGHVKKFQPIFVCEMYVKKQLIRWVKTSDANPQSQCQCLDELHKNLHFGCKLYLISDQNFALRWKLINFLSSLCNNDITGQWRNCFRESCVKSGWSPNFSSTSTQGGECGSKTTLNYWMMMERFPNFKEEVGGFNSQFWNFLSTWQNTC